MKKHKIFISSVQKEFQAERISLRDFIIHDPLFRRYFDVFLFEDIPARDRNPDSVYIEEVKLCDLYVCLLGNEYGSEDTLGVSATEREFQEATKCGKTRLLFIKNGYEKERHTKTARLIKKVGGEMIRRKFSNISELTTQMYAALVQYLEDEGILQTVPFDAAVCQGAAFSDIDEDCVNNFIETARAERKFPLPQNTQSKKLFTHLNLLNKERISHSAILLFCRKPQKFRSLICAEVKCMHFHGTEVCKPIPSYQIYKGTLFEQVDEAVDFVMGKIDRSVTPTKTGIASDVAYEIPKMVIREAVVNAVAHRDYTSNAGVQVMLFSDRLEVWNPGSLPPGMTFENLRVAHSSMPHNPLISEPLFWARYIERAGTGTLDMIALCRKEGIPEPEFEQRGGQFVLTIKRKKDSLLELVVQPNAQAEPQAGTKPAPSRHQVEILRKCLIDNSITELMKIAERKDRTKFRNHVLNPLIKEGLIERTIHDKPSSPLQKYRLTEKGKTYLKSQEKK